MVEDKEHSGRPPELDDDALFALVKSDSRLSTYEMSSRLGSSHITISRPKLAFGFVQKFGKRFPHQLTDDQRLTRATLCTYMLTCRRITQWLRDIIIGDEKWVLYVNHSRK